MLVASLLAVLADRSFKQMVARRPPGWASPPRWSLRLLHSRHVVTRQASPLIRGIGLLALLATAAALAPSWTFGARVCLGLALGGAIGNYLDERSPSGVVNCFSFRGRHAFNLADVAISGGGALGLLLLVLG